MPTYDRDELLERTDLEGLFTELVGPGRGSGRSATWPCPVPEHAQTGKSPPVSIDGENKLWACHGCGAGGTAIDLVMAARRVSIGEAMEELARRAHVRPTVERHDRRDAPRPTRRNSAPPRPPEAKDRLRRPATMADPAVAGALEAYVSDCARLLWEPAGADVLGWLRQRGLADEVLRANRVGADPGPAQLERAKGLPRRGVAAVFPVLGADGSACYCQARYLHGPAEHRHDNPDRSFGPNPRLAALVDPPGVAEGPVVICEGAPDALTMASAGRRAAAILGAGYPNEAVAAALVARYPHDHLVVAFDNDDRGRAGAAKLGELLAEAGAGRRVWELPLPGGHVDVNDWALAAAGDFVAQLDAAWARARPLGWERAPAAVDLLDTFFAQQGDVAGAVRIPTGIAALDILLAHGGWRPGVVLLGGTPGIGKSAFALHTALHAAGLGHPVLYVSVEQSTMEMLGRIFCRETRSGIASYWNREPAYLQAAQAAAGRLRLDNLYLRSDPFVVEDFGGTVSRVRQWATEVAEQTGATPLIIVDYLQRMRPPEAERRLDQHRQISLAGLGLRQLARDLSSPVLAISSVNRQSYDKPPSLDAFKGSGDLEYDADACLLLRFAARSDDEAKRMAETSGVAPVELYLVGKNRYGPTNVEDPIALDFDRSYGSFRVRGGGPTVPASTNGAGAQAAHPNPPPAPPSLYEDF